MLPFLERLCRQSRPSGGPLVTTILCKYEMSLLNIGREQSGPSVLIPSRRQAALCRIIPAK